MQYTLNLQVDCYNTITAHLSEEKMFRYFSIFSDTNAIFFFIVLYFDITDNQSIDINTVSFLYQQTLILNLLHNLLLLLKTILFHILCYFLWQIFKSK